MLIFIPQKIVLLSMPKTGSTALERALEPHASDAYSGEPGIKHLPARSYKELVEPSMELSGITNLETVALIRNPIKWLSSWYRYRYRWSIHDTKESTRGVSFDEFVEGYMAEKQPSYAKLGSQGSFLTSNDDEQTLLVDHLYQYEQFPRALRFLRKRLELPIELERKNESPKLKLSLSPEIEERFRAEHALDFKLWEEAHRQGPG